MDLADMRRVASAPESTSPLGVLGVRYPSATTGCPRRRPTSHLKSLDGDRGQHAWAQTFLGFFQRGVDLVSKPAAWRTVSARRAPYSLAAGRGRWSKAPGKGSPGASRSANATGTAPVSVRRSQVQSPSSRSSATFAKWLLLPSRFESRSPTMRQHRPIRRYGSREIRRTELSHDPGLGSST